MGQSLIRISGGRLIVSKSDFSKTRRRELHTEGGHLAVFAGVAVLMLLFAAWTPLRVAAIGGYDNYVFIPQSSSSQSSTTSISTTITASNSDPIYPAAGCNVRSQWSYQWNILNPSSLGNSWIQIAAEVNPSGNS
jgi:hypothetical protein